MYSTSTSIHGTSKILHDIPSTAVCIVVTITKYISI